VAQAGAEARPRKQCPQTFVGAVEAIGQDAPDAVGWLMLKRCTLKRPIGLGKSRRTGVLGVAEMPDHAATHNGRQIDLVGETVTVLFIGQEIHRQREPTPGQDRHQAVMAECANQTIEGHR
jgi:hypothetical protein